MADWEETGWNEAGSSVKQGGMWNPDDGNAGYNYENRASNSTSNYGNSDGWQRGKSSYRGSGNSNDSSGYNRRNNSYGSQDTSNQYGGRGRGRRTTWQNSKYEDDNSSQQSYGGNDYGKSRNWGAGNSSRYNDSGSQWNSGRNENTQNRSYGQRYPNPGDWNCPSCQFSNFASRTVCFRCNTSKGTDSYGDNGVQESQSARSNKGDYWSNKQGHPTIMTADGYEVIDWDAVNAKCDEMEKQRWGHLPKILKNFYVEDEAVKNMTQAELDAFRERSFEMEAYHSNTESTDPIPNPVTTFQQALHPYPEILKEILSKGFEHPTPIQSQSWPILMQGNDMIGIAQTGTGKTLAFILPALIHIVKQPTPRWQRSGPTCLVLAPTRELAQQIEKEIGKFKYQDIRCVCVYGQGDRRSQIRQIQSKAEIVVATPGRLNDFNEKGIIDLSSISYLVLDEADRMLDMGFEPQIRKIVLDIRPDRQNVMTSATWPEGVRDLAGKLLKDPIYVVVGSLDLKATHTVTQHIVILREDQKKEKLMNFIQRLRSDDKAIVFMARKCMVDLLSVDCFEAGLNVQSMHGDRMQEDRETALHDLRTGRTNVLLATDVASRGIDVNDVTHIVNYDCPRDLEDYVHRVGRTGRAGRTGEAFTFFTRSDRKIAGRLVDILEKSDQEVHPKLREWAEESEIEQANKPYNNRRSRW